MQRPYPSVSCLDAFLLPLAKMVAETSYLPHPDVVAQFSRAVFPTVRARKREQLYLEFTSGDRVGMYDDNTTPRWALMWTHGYLQTNRLSGWMHAHVWTAADDIDSYTHLANLIMVPECFGALTDKKGPLTSFLQWHAWEKYGWKAKHAAPPQKPCDYEEIVWQYLPSIDQPVRAIQQRVAELDNQRVKVLRRLMKISASP